MYKNQNKCELSRVEADEKSYWGFIHVRFWLCAPRATNSNKVVPQQPFHLTPPLRPAATAESIPVMCQRLCEEWLDYVCVWETHFKALHSSCITQHYVWCTNDRCGLPPVWWNSVGLQILSGFIPCSQSSALKETDQHIRPRKHSQTILTSSGNLNKLSQVILSKLFVCM